MPDQREDKIRQRAHQIWIEEGQPEGQDAEHWERATRELEKGNADPIAEASDSAGVANELKGGAGSASEQRSGSTGGKTANTRAKR
jgi:hypothetical protein